MALDHSNPQAGLSANNAMDKPSTPLYTIGRLEDAKVVATEKYITTKIMIYWH